MPQPPVVGFVAGCIRLVTAPAASLALTVAGLAFIGRGGESAGAGRMPLESRQAIYCETWLAGVEAFEEAGMRVPRGSSAEATLRRRALRDQLNRAGRERVRRDFGVRAEDIDAIEAEGDREGWPVG